MPITISLLLVLILLGMGLYATNNSKVSEIGRIVFFCALLVFLFAAAEHLQIDLVRRR